MASDSIWKRVYKFTDPSTKSKKLEFRSSATTGSVDMGDGNLCTFGGSTGSEVHVANFRDVPSFKVTNRKVKESVLPPEHGIDSPTGICICKLKLNHEK